MGRNTLGAVAVGVVALVGAAVVYRWRIGEQSEPPPGQVTKLLEVRANLQRALEADGGLDAIRDGVALTASQFDEALARQGVTSFEPDIGDSVDPTRHEVVSRIEADVSRGVVAEVVRTGWESGGEVVREARVAVGR